MTSRIIFSGTVYKPQLHTHTRHKLSRRHSGTQQPHNHPIKTLLNLSTRTSYQHNNIDHRLPFSHPLPLVVARMRRRLALVRQYGLGILSPPHFTPPRITDAHNVIPKSTRTNIPAFVNSTSNLHYPPPHIGAPHRGDMAHTADNILVRHFIPTL